MNIAAKSNQEYYRPYPITPPNGYVEATTFMAQKNLEYNTEKESHSSQTVGMDQMNLLNFSTQAIFSAVLTIRRMD